MHSQSRHADALPLRAIGVALLGLIGACASEDKSAAVTPIDSAVFVRPDSVVGQLSTFANTDSTPNDEWTPDDSLARRAASMVLSEYLVAEQFVEVSNPRVAREAECPHYPETRHRVGGHLAFVRPRIIKLQYQTSDAAGIVADANVEITRLALIRPDSADTTRRWALVRVSRDTIIVRMHVPEAGIRTNQWRVCGTPLGAFPGDTGLARWTLVPPAASETERLKDIAWKPAGAPVNSWATLRRLADSVSRLPASFVVEGNPAPEIPRLVRDYCPSEGCVIGRWLACSTTVVRAAPRMDAATTFTLSRGEFFQALAGEGHVKQSGMVVFKDSVHATDTESGMNLRFTPADTLYPLEHHAEGYGAWYFRGKYGGGFWFFPNDIVSQRVDTGVVVVRPSITEWWVEIENGQKQRGWILPREGGRTWPSIIGIAPHYEDMPLRCPTR